MKRRLLIAGLVLAGALSAEALTDGQDLEKTLAGQYADKTLVLRHCYTASSQEYDAGGKLLSRTNEGPWPLYGRIQVKKVDLTTEKLRLEGNRVVYQFDRQGRFIPVRDKDHIKITIRLDQPLTSVDQGAAVLARVFAMTQEEVINAAPSYWQPYLAKQLAEGTKEDQSQVARRSDLAGGAGTEGTEKHLPQVARRLDPASSAEAEKIFRLGVDGTAAPRPIYTPEPQFSELARHQKFQGVVGMNVVIDSSGQVSNIKIVKPLGMGLDEEAVRTIQTWRFTPGQRRGQPVAVAMYIEMDFHLY
jgi:TonB family protein